MGKKFTLEELSKVFYDVKSAKDKMWEADPNLERSMTIFQGTEKMLAPYSKLYGKKVSTAQLLLVSFIPKPKQKQTLNI